MQVKGIIVRKSRGLITVQATGQTPRGNTFVKKAIPLTVRSLSDPKFKQELSEAVTELLGSSS